MKTVNELIKELQDLVKTDATLGKCPVYVIADHGQTFIQMNQVSVDHTEAYDYYAEVIDLEEAEEFDEVKTFVTIGD